MASSVSVWLAAAALTKEFFLNWTKEDEGQLN